MDTRFKIRAQRWQQFGQGEIEEITVEKKDGKIFVNGEETKETPKDINFAGVELRFVIKGDRDKKYLVYDGYNSLSAADIYKKLKE